MADRHPLGRRCGDPRVLAVVLLLMPYALMRHAAAQLAERHTPEPYGPRNPQCPAVDATGLDCAGPAGHPDGSDHANVNGTWSSGGGL